MLIKRGFKQSRLYVYYEAMMFMSTAAGFKITAFLSNNNV